MCGVRVDIRSHGPWISARVGAGLARASSAVYSAVVRRKTIGATFALAVPGLFGCGAEPGYVAYAEVCGEAGPVRVLALESGERLNGRPIKVGERVVFTVGRAAPDEAGQPSPSTIGKVLWTTGPCGEAPRKLVHDVDSAYTVSQWPGLLLACDSAAGELLAIDPTGAAPANAVFTGLSSCDVSWTPHGMVSLAVQGEDEGDIEGVDPGLGTLLLHPYPADPLREVAEPVPLLEALRTTSLEGEKTGQQLQVFPEFALALTADNALVRVELADGAVTQLQTGVAAFVADDAGRYVLWQDVTPTNDNRNYPAGKLFLRDRSDSTDVFLGEAALAFNGNALRYLDRGVIYLGLAAIRVFSVPDMGFHDLPDVGRIAGMLDEHRWLLAGQGMLNLVELQGDQAIVTTTLYRGYGDIDRVLEDGVDLLKVEPCCQRSSLRAEGPLWFIPFAGEPRRLAERASRWGRVLSDGRRATMLDIGGDWRGTLTLVDPATEEVLRIDDGVFAQIYAAKQVFGADVLVYSIPRGERAGVWIARVAPVDPVDPAP
jgi:hypothetical protein